MSDQHSLPESLPELPNEVESGGWAAPEPIHFGESKSFPIQAEPDTLAYADAAHVPDAVEVITEEDLPHPQPLSTGGEGSNTAESPVSTSENIEAGVEESITSDTDSPSLLAERGLEGEVNSLTFRVDALTRRIEEFPNAPVNYVLRGEVYSEGGDDDLAEADFRRAIELAEAHDEALDWGYINAAYIDRARAGLRELNRDQH